MTPALFVEFGLKPFRHLRIIVIAHVAVGAWHAGATADAGVLTFPWSIRVGFTNPAAVLAEYAAHYVRETFQIFRNYPRSQALLICHPPVLTSPNPLSTLHRRSLALASLNRTCRDHCPGVSATLTTTAFDQSDPRWLGISDLIVEPKGPTFISYKVARSRLNGLRFVTQDPMRNSRARLGGKTRLMRLSRAATCALSMVRS